MKKEFGSCVWLFLKVKSQQKAETLQAIFWLVETPELRKTDFFQAARVQRNLSKVNLKEKELEAVAGLDLM